MLSQKHPSRPQAIDKISNKRLEKLKLYYPVCNKFAPKNPTQRNGMCQCNRQLRAHDENIEDYRPVAEKEKEERWTTKTHTTQREAHVKSLPNGSKYIRLALDTDMYLVEHFLTDVWNITSPPLIISVIGTAKYFVANDRLKSNFITNITNVAIKSDIWMITNGYDTGVARLVGQAIKVVKLQPDNKLVSIGICKYGCVKNLKDEQDRQNKKAPNRNTRSDEDADNDTDDEEDKTKHEETNVYELEKHHTRFLMVDDGRYRHIDTADFRTRFCCRLADLDGNSKPNTHTVTIVAEGGINTIENIYNDLKNNIPVVIIDGSNGVADFFKGALLYTKQFDSDSKQRKKLHKIDELYAKDENPPSTHDQDNRTAASVELRVDRYQKKLYDVFAKYKEQLEIDLRQTLFYDDAIMERESKDLRQLKETREEEFTRALDQVLYCLQPNVRSNIRIFNLNSDDDLSETILKSICYSYKKLSKNNKEKQEKMADVVPSDSSGKYSTDDCKSLLRLAMDWNCIDVAKEFVLENDLENIAKPDEAFTEALTKNLPMFVYEFIKMGIDPSEIFFWTNQTSGRYRKFIDTLYTDEIINKAGTPLKIFIHDNRKINRNTNNVIDSIEALNVILCDIVGDHMHKLYFHSMEEEVYDRIDQGLMKDSDEELIKNSDSDEDNKYRQRKPALDVIKHTERDYIMRDLFLWAVLMNYVDMAKVFLAHMKYRLCPALIATKILKEYHDKATYGELKDTYKKSAAYFEQYAIKCLDQCDRDDPDQACAVLLQQNELYGYVSCLQMAADAKDKLFIARPCCFQAMNNIWYDKLYPDQTRTQDIVALVLGFLSFSLLAPAFVEYRAKATGVVKRKLESYGINYSDAYALEHPRISSSMLGFSDYILKIGNFQRSILMKFCCHFVVYLFFLLLFSYFLLYNFSPPTDQHPSIHWTEILTIILVSCMLIEEIRYFVSQDNLTFVGKWKSYFRDMFKWLTLPAFLLFYIGLILRFGHADSEEQFVAARIVMAFDIELWWLRFLSFIIVIPYLGPQLVAIGKMLKDLFFFIVIIAIVMSAYGVASRSMVYYPVVNGFTTQTGGSIDTSFNGRSVFRQVFYPVYYFLYGNIGTELTNLDTNPDAGWSIVTHVLLAFHMLFVNILLVNLLIAMFSKRFDEVYVDTQNIWHTQQYRFTREYYTRSAFPPLGVIYDIFRLCQMFFYFIRRKISGKAAGHTVRVFKMIPIDKQSMTEWFEFESASTYEYAHAEVKAFKVSSKKLTPGSSSRSAEINYDMMNIQNESNNIVTNAKQTQDDVIKLNSSMKEMQEQLSEYFKSITQLSSTQKKGSGNSSSGNQGQSSERPPSQATDESQEC